MWVDYFFLGGGGGGGGGVKVCWAPSQIIGGGAAPPPPPPPGAPSSYTYEIGTGEGKEAEEKEGAPPFICCVQDTVELYPPLPLRLLGNGKLFFFYKTFGKLSFIKLDF